MPDKFGDTGGSSHNKSYADLVTESQNDLRSNTQRLGMVLKRIVTHTENHRGIISLPPEIVVDEEGLLTLAKKLNDPVVDTRLERNLKERPYIKDQVRHLVAASLHTALGVPKKNAGTAAGKLLTTLFEESSQSKPVIEKEITHNLLNSNLLDQGMTLASLVSEEGSVVDQLKDPFILARNGLIVTTSDGSTDRGFELPQTLLAILRDLKYPESAEVLENWLYQKLSGDEAEQCIGFLQTLTEFTVFLDSETYFQLYASGDEVSLLPFHSLHKGVARARNYLKDKGGYENAVAQLENTQDLIISRFHQILVGPLKEELSARNPKVLEPLMDDLVFRFKEWAEPRIELGMLDTREAASYIVYFLQQTGIENIREFAALLSSLNGDEDLNGGHDVLSEEIIREAVRVNALRDSEGSYLREAMVDTYDRLRAEPFVDLADQNLGDLIEKDTETIEVFYAPGTYGFWTYTGHGDFRTKIMAYMDHLDVLDAMDSQRTKTQRILVVAPIPKTNAPDYKKKFANVGRLDERVGAIILQNADVDRKRMFLTTKLQPEPAQAGDILRSINHFRSAFSRQLVDDMKTRGRLATQGVQITLCSGLDELNWEKRDEEYILSKVQNRKFTKGGNNLLVGRYGYLMQGFQNAQEILQLTPADFVFTPGSPHTSSTEAINQLHLRGNTPMVLATALPYVSKHWSPEMVNKRASGAIQEPIRVPSVTTISKRVTNEYHELLKMMGIDLGAD